MGDFWGVKDTYPELYDSNGVSCLIVNTKHGFQFLSELKVPFSEVDYQRVLSYNPSIVKAVKCTPFRKLFFKFMGKIPFKNLVLIGLAYNKIFRTFNCQK